MPQPKVDGKVREVHAEPGTPPLWVLREHTVLAMGLSLAAAATSVHAAGDAQRGRTIVADRQVGMCLLCHPAPIREERFQGDLAPSLAGVGARWSAADLRERIVDARRSNPQTVMPPYGSTAGLNRLAPSARGRPLLDDAQIDDVVAYLATLKD